MLVNSVTTVDASPARISCLAMRSLRVLEAVLPKFSDGVMSWTASLKVRSGVASMLVVPVFTALTMSETLDVRSVMALGMSLVLVKALTEVSKAVRPLWMLLIAVVKTATS